MKAYKYKMEVSESIFHFNHGIKKNIEEVFIPKYKIAFNSDGYIIDVDDPRSKDYEEIKISKSDADFFLELSVRKKESLNRMVKFFK